MRPGHGPIFPCGTTKPEMPHFGRRAKSCRNLIKYVVPDLEALARLGEHGAKVRRP